MEILSLLEPHKCRQNSVTMTRRTGEYRDVLWEDEIGRLEADALALLG